MASSDTTVVNTNSIFSKLIRPSIGITNARINKTECSISDEIEPIHLVAVSATFSSFTFRSSLKVITQMD